MTHPTDDTRMRAHYWQDLQARKRAAAEVRRQSARQLWMALGALAVFWAGILWFAIKGVMCA